MVATQIVMCTKFQLAGLLMVVRGYIHDVIHIGHRFSATMMADSAYALSSNRTRLQWAVITWIYILSRTDLFPTVASFINSQYISKVILSRGIFCPFCFLKWMLIERYRWSICGRPNQSKVSISIISLHRRAPWRAICRWKAKSVAP